LLLLSPKYSENEYRKMLFFLLLMLLFRSVCHQVSNQGDKLDLLAILIISRRFAHLFKWTSSGQCFLTTYNMQLTNNNKTMSSMTYKDKTQNWPSRYRNGRQHATEIS